MKDRPSQRILVVDDNELVRKATVALILKMGYACDAVSSGEKALARLQTEDFDIVLSDVVMNGMSGMEFMKRAKEGFPQSDFIIMTGYTSEYSYADIIKAGAIDYLAKPFERAELQARLGRAIKERTLFRESRRMLRELEESRAYALGLIESCPDALVTFDKDGMITGANVETAKLTGCAREELIGSQFRNYFTDPERAAEGIRKFFEEGKVTDYELVVKSKAGTEFPISLSISSINLKNKWDAVGIARDISERKKIEKEIRLANSELNQIFNTAADGMRIIDRNFNIVKINETFSILSGISRNESKGMKCYDIFPTPLCHSSSCLLVQILNGEQRIECEIEKNSKDGDKTFYSVIATPFSGPDGELVGIIEDIRNITESRQIIGQLLQSEKMASIGQLAAGIAHEINNPTGFVSSNLKTLSDYQDDISTLIEQYRRLVTDLKETMATAGYPVAISEQLERIAKLEAKADMDFVLKDIPDLVKESQEGTERIKNIVINLKDFAHPGEDKPKLADINRNMESTLNVVWNELKYKTTVTKDYGDLPEVECYPQQLNQVFMNLLVNAAQAIEKQGKIRIVTRSVDGYAEIRISDTGTGIPEENISKIFDPFFTTKEVGKGTGLGLNVAYNIIKKHNGTINIESTVGKGTTFTIRIPVQKEV